MTTGSTTCLRSSPTQLPQRLTDDSSAPASDHGGVTAALHYDTDQRPQPVLRRGRHRNRALASYRCSRAVEMAAGGCTYQRIADALGYANRGTVHRLVGEALEAQQVESVEVLRTVEVQRLDALQASLWPAALGGDVEAAMVCLRIIMGRVKVLGLVETGGGKRLGCQQPQTVILREDDCRTRGCPEHT